jgi:CRISPR-associated protein Cas2
LFIVVAYDIKDDKRRNRVAKTMEDYGTRVQYSVFECNLGEKILEKMKDTLSSVIDEENDNVRIYKLCNGCIKAVKILGSGEMTQDEDVYIV